MAMTHALATQVLAPYVDGALPLAEAAAVRDHLAGCTSCSAEVADLQVLNQAVRFPAAPPVPFHTFWIGVEKKLPKRPGTRVIAVPRTAALAFALAALLVLATAASAFASDRIMPDSPLYALKRVGEDARVSLTLSRRDRTRLELQLAAERLREARQMAQEDKNQLAVASLKDFQSLVADATPALADEAPADRQETLQQLDALQDDLAQVEKALTSEPDASDLQVQSIVHDSQATLAQDAKAAARPAEPEPTPTTEANPTSQPRDTPSAPGPSSHQPAPTD